MFIGLMVPENGSQALLPLLQVGGINTRKCENLSQSKC